MGTGKMEIILNSVSLFCNLSSDPQRVNLIRACWIDAGGVDVATLGSGESRQDQVSGVDLKYYKVYTGVVFVLLGFLTQIG